MYVTEDTTRCDPEMVKRLYSAAINCGAKAIVVCDTAGHATPMGVFALLRFVLQEVVKPSGEKIRVDWHTIVTAGWQWRIRWRRWSRAPIASTPARLVWASVSATRRWTRCWSI